MVTTDILCFLLQFGERFIGLAVNNRE